MRIVFDFQDLTWQVVVWDEIGQNSFSIFILVLHHKRINDTILWHQMVRQLILAELKAHIIFLGQLFVQLENLWDIWTFHCANISDNVNIFYIWKGICLLVLLNSLSLPKSRESAENILLWIEWSVEILCCREGMREHGAWSVEGWPNTLKVHTSGNFLD